MTQPPCLNDVVPALSRFPHARLVMTGPGGRQEYSYQQLGDRVSSVAAALSRLGVAAQDNVGLLAANSIDWLAVDLASLTLGAVSVPFDPGQDWGSYDVLRREWALAVLVADRGGAKESWLAIDALATEAATPQPPPYQFSPSQASTVKFSSGTSARPKAVRALVSHFDHMARHIDAMFPMNGEDRILVMASLGTWLQRFMIHLGMTRGATIVIAPPEHALRVLERERPTIVLGVPRLLETVHNIHLRRLRHKPEATLMEAWGGRLRYLWTGSAAIDHELLIAFERAQIPVFEGYGMTETGMIAKNHPGQRRLGSVGKAFPEKEIRLDEDGQILVRSAFHANSGYWRGDGGVFRPGGWVATGDIGHFDADGFLYLDGRVNDVQVLSSGHKVFPSKVEERLRRDPRISECVVLGHGRPHLVAVVTPGDSGVTDAELERALMDGNRDVAAAEQVLGFVRCDGFTIERGFRNANGKIRRRAIAEAYAEPLAALYRHV